MYFSFYSIQFQMHSELSRVWWSRLIISVRGYVVNYVQDDDEKLFLADDAFIIIHRKLVESVNSNAVQQVCFIHSFLNVVKFLQIQNFRNFPLPGTGFLLISNFPKNFLISSVYRERLANKRM